MLDFIWSRLDQGARLAMPFATTLLCTLLSVIPWPLPWFGGVTPPLALIALYYWAIHRPDLFGPFMAFLIGILNDVVNGLPLGLSGFLFVAAYQFILQQRRFFSGHSFLMMWAGFALTAVTVMLAEWLLLCLLRWQGIPFFPVAMQFLLAMAFFPLPCQIFIRLQRSFLSQN